MKTLQSFETKRQNLLCFKSILMLEKRTISLCSVNQEIMPEPEKNQMKILSHKQVVSSEEAVTNGRHFPHTNSF